MKILISILLIFLIIFPVATANNEEDDSSLVGNLASSLIKHTFKFISDLVNAPIKPLVSLIRSMLSAVINLDLFKSLWVIIIYTLSMFYSLLLLYSGFNFMISGYDIIKREKAKEWLKNIIIMMVLVQGSFFFYKVLVELSSILTTAILNMIPDEFFLITFNSPIEIIYYAAYLAVLLITALLLIIRYLIVSFGVVFFPIGIFLYFIAFTKDYGKAIINFLLTCVFISFFNAVILLCCSKLITINLFEHFKIMVMIASFLMVSLVTFYFMLFTLIKSGVNAGMSVVNPIGSLVKKFI